MEELASGLVARGEEAFLASIFIDMLSSAP
jgi:hypothetical protein